MNYQNFADKYFFVFDEVARFVFSIEEKINRAGKKVKVAEIDNKILNILIWNDLYGPEIEPNKYENLNYTPTFSGKYDPEYSLLSGSSEYDDGDTAFKDDNEPKKPDTKLTASEYFDLESKIINENFNSKKQQLKYIGDIGTFTIPALEFLSEEAGQSDQYKSEFYKERLLENLETDLKALQDFLDKLSIVYGEYVAQLLESRDHFDLSAEEEEEISELHYHYNIDFNAICVLSADFNRKTQKMIAEFQNLITAGSGIGKS